MSKITTLRGMNDLPPEEVRVWNFAEEIIQKVFNSYGYEEIRFPIVEKTELFTRSNESADIVTKEMYTFEDKGGDSISLRPEGTAGCVRAAIDNDLIRIDSPRLWYQGPMFRYERPQKGRSRQFQQSSAEVFGIRSAEIDAELIILSSRIWKELGVENTLNLEINNIGDEKTRNSYAKSLQNYFKDFKRDLDEDSIRKLDENPLRILDSKSESVQNLLKDAPDISEYISKDSKKEFNKLIESIIYIFCGDNVFNSSKCSASSLHLSVVEPPADSNNFAATSAELILPAALIRGAKRKLTSSLSIRLPARPHTSNNDCSPLV